MSDQDKACVTFRLLAITHTQYTDLVETIQLMGISTEITFDHLNEEEEEEEDSGSN